MSALLVYTRVWTVPEFYCRERRGERTRVTLVSDDGRAYLRTETDPLVARATA